MVTEWPCLISVFYEVVYVHRKNTKVLLWVMYCDGPAMRKGAEGAEVVCTSFEFRNWMLLFVIHLLFTKQNNTFSPVSLFQLWGSQFGGLVLTQHTALQVSWTGHKMVECDILVKACCNTIVSLGLSDHRDKWIFLFQLNIYWNISKPQIFICVVSSSLCFLLGRDVLLFCIISK